MSWLIRKVDKHYRSNMPPKQSLEHSNYADFGMPGKVKRLKVDWHQQCQFSHVENLKHGGERRDIRPAKSSGLSSQTHANDKWTEQLVPYGKKVVDPGKMVIGQKLEMRPPKAIRNAIVVRVGPKGRSQPMHFNIQSMHDSSYHPQIYSRPQEIQKEMHSTRLNPVSSSRCDFLPDGTYDVERRSLEEIIRTYNDRTEVGFQNDEDATELAENCLKDNAGIENAETRNIKVARFDKFKPGVPCATQSSSQSNTINSNLRHQLIGGNNSYGARSHDKNDTRSIIIPPKTECIDLAPSFCVGVTSKQDANPILSPTTYKLEGLKNEITSFDESNTPKFKVDKASELIFTRGKSLNCGGRAEKDGLSDNSGGHSCSLAFEGNGYQVALCRNEMRKTLDLFKKTLENLQQEDKMKLKGQRKGGMQIHIAAAMRLKEQRKWINVDKPVGSVPGVEIGNRFQSRAELVIIGLHSEFFAGIDYKKIGGEICAISIVSSDRYGDINESPDILTYMGEGNCKTLEDQKLIRGNLALMNSKDKVPVRVIRSCQNMNAPKWMDKNVMKKSTYVYDGLFAVTKCRPEAEPCGRLVYKFTLKRIEGQQKCTGWGRLNKKASYGPIVIDDISQGKEKMPIRAINAIDSGKPPPFEYITKMMCAEQHSSMPSVCYCSDGCLEDTSCSCIIKNNGEVPLNGSLSISEKKPIVYECGPHCKCLPDCKNRVSQNGIRLQLEIFKTKSMRWGVRSRNFVTAGRFICEYVGELLRYNPNEERIDFDKLVYDTGNYYGDQGSQDHHSMQLISSKGVNDNDARIPEFGNVGRFIKHSSTPNLCAKCVLFDHEDKSRPHVMLFAAKSIPPLIELTFDYKIW